MMPTAGTLHVAVASNEFPKLSETFVLDHVKGLLDRGVRVTVQACSPPPGEPLHPDAEGLDVTRVERDRTPGSRQGQLVLLASALRPLGPRRLLSTVLRSRRERRVGVVRSVIEATSVLDMAADIDVIHCHFGPVGAALLDAVRGMGLTVPVVTTFHGYDVSRRGDISSEYAGLFEDPRSLLLPVSDRWRRLLIDAGARPQRTTTHRVGIDLAANEFDFRPRTSGPLRVLSVGRVVEKKGFADAADAVAAAVAQGHDVHWTVIGDGPERGRLERKVARLELQGRVDLLGHRTRDEVRQAMRTSHVLLAPSRTAADGDMEGIPVVLMEAMAAGLPVVSTTHSGIPELVVDEDSGLLVGEGETSALAQSVARLDREEQLRRRLAEAGRVRVAALHDAEQQLDGLMQHYRRLVSSPTADLD